MRASKSLCWAWCGLTISLSLDRIGAAAFEYDFGALDETDNPFTKSYTNLLYDRLPSSSAVQGSRRAYRSTCLPGLSPSGIPLDQSFSSWPSQIGFRGCSHGYTTTPTTRECRSFDITGSKCAVLLGSYSIRRDKS